MQNYRFHKGTDLDIYKKALFFLKIKNRSQRVQILLTATRVEGRR